MRNCADPAAHRRLQAARSDWAESRGDDEIEAGLAKDDQRQILVVTAADLLGFNGPGRK